MITIVVMTLLELDLVVVLPPLKYIQLQLLLSAEHGWVSYEVEVGSKQSDEATSGLISFSFRLSVRLANPITVACLSV